MTYKQKLQAFFNEKYEKDILKKKEAIEYYKQVISFCEGL